MGYKVVKIKKIAVRNSFFKIFKQYKITRISPS